MARSIPWQLSTLVLVSIAAGSGVISASREEASRLHRPIQMTLADSGKRLLVANRDSGSVAILDTETMRLLSEIRAGAKLSDMTASPAGDLVLLTDEQTGHVIRMEYRQGGLRETGRYPVGLSPVSVRLTEDGKLATVACLWPRQLWVLDVDALARKDRPTAASFTIDLPFCPRRQLMVPGTTKVIVADAFAGKVALVDLRAKTVDSVRDMAVHNIRGLSWDPGARNVWVTHQVLHARGHTTAGEIRTGNLLTNNIHRLARTALLEPRSDILGGDAVYSLGDVEQGAGDPAEVFADGDGRLVITLAGVNELAIGRPELGLWTRLPVDRRPGALVVDSARQRAYVANMFADTISVVDLQTTRVVGKISLGSVPELSAQERGEMLFFDARLSFESWFSCHSCHTDGHTNGRLNDNFSDGSFGTPKRVLTLLGVKETGPWAWNGSMPDLEEQVRTSLKSTMQGPAPKADQVKDLKAYLETLAPPPALLKARGAVDREALKRGKKVFAQQKCSLCHTPPTYTSAKTYDVGVHDELGGKQFNPPSLRGVSQGGPYFHDGRAVSLEEVFTRHKHEITRTLTDAELRDLLYFLESL